MRRRPPAGQLCATALLAAFAACGTETAGPGAVEGEWRAERDTVGDTVVVRTLSGSVWGDSARLVEELRIGRLEGPPEETFGRIVALDVGPDGTIYVADRQAPALRAYAADGSYRRTLGGEGGGPGEYQGLNGLNMLAVHPDGRVLLRVPANSRINVYGPDGSLEEHWPIRGGVYSSYPLSVDTAGRVWHTTFELGDEGPRLFVVRFDAEGTATDTLPADRWSYEAPQLSASSGDGENGFSTIRSVPFTSRARWTISAHGYLVGGVSTAYEVELMRTDGPVVRLSRAVPPVPVLPEEKGDERERLVAQMRQVNPSWRWSGPTLPSTKAPFRDLLVDDDGRVWVLRHTRAERIPDEELEEPDSPNDPPPERWREPIVYDVFRPDGRYLGPVRAPVEFSNYPRPVIRGDTVWATAEDELGVEYVVRYRIERGGDGS